MEVLKYFTIELDVKRSSANRPIEVVEGDNGNMLDVILTDDGHPVYLDGCFVVAVFAKSGGTTVQQDSNGHGITIAEDPNNELMIELYTSSFAPGIVECEILVFSGENQDRQITSAKFNFSCRRSIMNEDTIQATDEYPILVDLIQSVEETEASLADIDENESTRESNEAVRISSESTRVSAEGFRASADSARNVAEQGRVTAEQGRGTAEGVRVSQESTRQSNDSTRQSNEAARISQENTRQSQETTRGSNEATRQSQETVREGAEDDRETAEGLRDTAEGLRESAELAREAAEGLRGAAELERGTAEGLRATAENARDTAEGLRESDELLRSAAEEARESAEADRDASEGLRDIAEMARDGAESDRASNELARVAHDEALVVWEDYDAEQAYVPLNKVQFGGSSYVCIANTTGHAPPNATYWRLIAAKGVDGEGAGDMLASTYAESPGVVKDSAKLGGQLPAYYAAASSIPGDLADLGEDATHRTVTDTEKSTWSGKQDALGFTPINAIDYAATYAADLFINVRSGRRI